MKTALIFGSSGLVGKKLLSQVVNNSNYSKIKIFVRSSPDISDRKIEMINTDFKDLEIIKNLIMLNLSYLFHLDLLIQKILEII